MPHGPAVGSAGRLVALTAGLIPRHSETIDRPVDVGPVLRRAGDEALGAMFYRPWLALHGYTLDDGYAADGVDLRFGGAGGRVVHVSKVLDELIIRRDPMGDRVKAAGNTYASRSCC